MIEAIIALIIFIYSSIFALLILGICMQVYGFLGTLTNLNQSKIGEERRKIKARKESEIEMSKQIQNT